MTAQETKLKGCFILEPAVYKDDRGAFFESFSQKKFEELTGQPVHFVQDNQSTSVYGTVRGLHFQRGAHAQAKLVRVLSGAVLDIAVDLRPGSATYGQWVAVKLSSENHLQLYIPRGFAHGFSVLEDHTVFAYKCDNYYNKESEGGIRYNDPQLAIEWEIPEDKMLLSEKDIILPYLSSLNPPVI